MTTDCARCQGSGWLTKLEPYPPQHRPAEKLSERQVASASRCQNPKHGEDCMIADSGWVRHKLLSEATGEWSPCHWHQGPEVCVWEFEGLVAEVAHPCPECRADWVHPDERAKRAERVEETKREMAERESELDRPRAAITPARRWDGG